MAGKEKKPTITKDTVPEGFTLSLALVDAVPVLLFAVAIILLGVKAAMSPLIILGGLLCFIGGAIKVLWKVIVATKQKNVWWMFVQMRPMMLLGFLLLMVGCVVSRHALAAAFSGIGVVSIVCIVLWFAGMTLMGVFAAKLDSSDPKSNWIEQGTNGIAHLFLCLGLALL